MTTFKFKVASKDGMPGYVEVKNFGAAIAALKTDPEWAPVYSYTYFYRSNRTFYY